MDCGHRCHEIGGPWIAENPDCPVHGSGGYGDREDEMRSVIQELCEMLEGIAESRDEEVFEMIRRARAL